MSTLKVTNIQHPDSSVANLRLSSDGTIEFYDGSDWKALKVAEIDPIVATGGDETFEVIDGGIVWNVHLFTGSGNFVVTDGDGNVDVMLCAGGGGGGGTSRRGAAGGGGGGVLRSTVSVTVGTYPMVVGTGGAGGASGANDGTKGNDSTGFGLTAEGGGFGARGSGTQTNNGGDGGSGGGGTGNASVPGKGNLLQGTDASASSIADATGAVLGNGGGAGGAPMAAAVGGGPAYVATEYGRLLKVGAGGPAGGRFGAITKGGDGTTFGQGGGGAIGTSTDNNVAGGAGADGIIAIRYPVRFV